MSEQAAALATIDAYVNEHGIDTDRLDDQTVVVILPGEHRLKTNVALAVGEQAVTINAFVVRAPDEHHETVYRWMLERNQRIYGIAYALDRLGDIYLVGHLPLHAVTDDELDRVFGSILQNSDGAFDHLLELGFETSIRREWAWRLSRGENTRNLQAFRHLADPVALAESEGTTDSGSTAD